MQPKTRTDHFRAIQKNIRNRLSEFKLDCFLITSLPHVRYISGFSGSAGLCLIFNNSKYFITDKRYTEQAAKEISGWKIIPSQNDIFETIAENNLIPNNYRIGIDGNNLTFAQYQNLKKLFPNNRVLPKAGFIEDVAIVKDAYEIEQITKAVEISDKVFSKILNIIKPGIRELDISAEITYLHKKFGAERDAFEPIVASGINSAFPHARSSSKKLRKGDIITIDIGCVVNGYNSDMTRTIFLGKPARPSGEPKSDTVKIYRTVLSAQLNAIEAAIEGLTYKELDAVARNTITNADYSEYFTHSLGHGVGLQIHEPPRLSVKTPGNLKADTVVTIEPGIYIPNFGGVRIEDIIVISRQRNKQHPNILTQSTKEMIIL
ncbi:MAG: aminopeptidase P family protein [Bacteroidota bacterium]|nr:aminopeptidase P family protein [Bacteroidota bacterium]